MHCLPGKRRKRIEELAEEKKERHKRLRENVRLQKIGVYLSKYTLGPYPTCCKHSRPPIFPNLMNLIVWVNNISVMLSHLREWERQERDRWEKDPYPWTCFHYENTPIQTHCKFYHRKYENIKMKNCDIFLIFAQNIDCGYLLEPPRWSGSNEYPQSMFSTRNKKNNVYSCKPQFYYIKVGFKGIRII